MTDKITATFLASLFLIATLFIATAEGQQGWSQAHIFKQGGQPASINAVFYNGEEIWVVGADGAAARSYDDGRSFQELDLRINEGLNDVFIRRDKIWIVGDSGTILVSTDGGESFVKSLYTSYHKGTVDPGKRNAAIDLYSVQFVDSNVGYIVGDQGLILETGNGGTSWREQTSGTDAQLFHLSFQGRRGWVVGTGGVILHTSDGGRNWYPQQSGTKDDLNRIYMITDEVGLITGDNGALLRTENGGATWERLRLRTTEPLFGISFIDKKTGWIVGYNGRIIRTYDGGRTWVEQVSETSADLFSVSFQKGRGFAIGRDGLVMRYFEKR